MKIKLSRKAAFTLVEIMIVVAIIGLLAGIAIPNFIKARETARKNTCINNLRLIDAAIQQWAMENNKNGSDPVSAGFADDLSQPRRHRTSQWQRPGRREMPSGGTYSATSVDTKPACSKTDLGHKLRARQPKSPFQQHRDVSDREHRVFVRSQFYCPCTILPRLMPSPARNCPASP